MRVVLYARVSTQQQADKQLSISAQLRALNAYAGEKGWEVVEAFVDEGKSGRTASRPGFKQMLIDVKYRDIDAVFVWKLDRLARNMEISTALDSHLRDAGVRIISLHEPIDDSPQGKLTARIFESFAEFYSNNLSQDIRRGKREAARQGRYPHGRAPIGFKKEVFGDSQRSRIVPDETYAPVIRRIFEEYANGSTAPQIAAQLNGEGIWTSSGRRWINKRIYDILRNAVYCGDVVIGRQRLDLANKVHPGNDPVTVKDAHEPLVSRDLFNTVQERLTQRSASHQQRRWDVSPFLLTGLVRCGECGRHMAGATAKSGRHSYYTCQKRVKEGKDACSSKSVPQKTLERFVLARIKDVILSEEHLRILVEQVNEELAVLRGQTADEITVVEKSITATKARLNRHYEALEAEVLDMRDVAGRIREVREDLRSLEKRKAELSFFAEQTETECVDRKAVLAYVRGLRRTLDLGSLIQRKGVISGIIDRVVVDSEGVEIHYRLPHPKEETADSLPAVLSTVTLSGA